MEMRSGRMTWSSGLLVADGADRGELRGVGGEGIAAAERIGGDVLLDALEHDGGERHLVGAEIVGEVQLRRRARLHADRGAVEVAHALHVRLLRHHEALAVVEIDAGHVEAERRVAHQRLCGVARQDVDLARLQRHEALLRRHRRVSDLGRVAEHRRGDGLAQIDVDAGPDAARIRGREAGHGAVDAALDEALGLDRVERGAGDRRRREAGAEKRSQQSGKNTAHVALFPLYRCPLSRSAIANCHENYIHRRLLAVTLLTRCRMGDLRAQRVDSRRSAAQTAAFIVQTRESP